MNFNCEGFCCSNTSNVITLSIQDHNDCRYSVNITCKATIKEVKNQISVDPLKSQLYKGRTKLENNQTLESYGIVKHQNLYLIYGRHIQA